MGINLLNGLTQINELNIEEHVEQLLEPLGRKINCLHKRKKIPSNELMILNLRDITKIQKNAGYTSPLIDML